MKDMNKAERMIWKAAQDVVSTKRGKNEFTTAEYAMGQFNAFCEWHSALSRRPRSASQRSRRWQREKPTEMGGGKQYEEAE